MRVLVVYCNPCPESFGAALRDAALAALDAGGHEVRLIDLYAQDFNPVMDAAERRGYHDRGGNEEPVRAHLDAILWCEGLLFVYPTWWYGLPAMLKGWLDRVWVPHVTFTMPTEDNPIQPNMQHIKRLGVVTTCGATWWWSKIVGEPGRRTLLRGIRALCHRRCRSFYLAHYEMDSSTTSCRSGFLSKVGRRISRW